MASGNDMIVSQSTYSNIINTLQWEAAIFAIVAIVFIALIA